MVFAKCMKVGPSTISLVILIVHQREMNYLGCHVGLNDVVVLILLRRVVNGRLGEMRGVERKRGTWNCEAAFYVFRMQGPLLIELNRGKMIDLWTCDLSNHVVY